MRRQARSPRRVVRVGSPGPEDRGRARYGHQQVLGVLQEVPELGVEELEAGRIHHGLAIKTSWSLNLVTLIGHIRPFSFHSPGSRPSSFSSSFSSPSPLRVTRTVRPCIQKGFSPPLLSSSGVLGGHWRVKIAVCVELCCKAYRSLPLVRFSVRPAF